MLILIDQFWWDGTVSQRLIVTLCIFLTLISSLAFANSKVEELFIWKMSEELDLSPKEEKKFSEKFRELNNKKNSLNSQLQQLVQNDSGSLPPVEAKDFLRKYQNYLSAGNRIGIEEIEAMTKILGPARTVQYLRIKHDLSGKVRTLLNEGAKNKAGGTLPPPKVIVE